MGLGGELYGGSMFIKSAASDTGQGKAIQDANEKWGEGRWNGRETLGVAVCKKKYAPFSFSVVEDEETGEKEVKVERMFGCHCHSAIRKEKIEQYGVRAGWEPFGQWSMRKAVEMARRETERINGRSSSPTPLSSQSASICTEAVVSSDEELKSMCNNGNCAWKVRAKYDNIFREVTGFSSDEE